MNPAVAAIAFSILFFGALFIVAVLETRWHARPSVKRRDAALDLAEQTPPLHLPRW